jgi:tetratricopeptide (TPR) repeat protein
MEIRPETRIKHLRTNSLRETTLAAGRSAAAIALAIFAISLLASCAGGPKGTDGTVQPVSATANAKEPSPEQKRIQAVETAANLLGKGEASAAADKLAELAAASPADPELKLAQAAALVSAGKIAIARKNIDAILASDPNNLHALSMGAELARFDGDDKARRSYLDRALVAAPADASVLSSWGDYYLDAKTWPKAEDFYKRALAVDPKSADATLGLGRALYREAKYSEAEAQLTAAIKLEPDSPLAYSDRSRARYQQGKYKESEDDLDTAISKAPDESWLYLDRGRHRLDKRDMPGAESDFDKAIALEPGYFLSYTYRGGIREEEGKDELALADYRKVIELYPDYWYAFESAGAAAFRLGLWSESAIDFKRAFDASPDRYEYAIAASLALWRAGKPKEASSLAGTIAPGIDREKNGIYWNILRLIQDQNDASAELELKIQAEKHLDLKSAMLFYLSEYWICRGKTDLAAKYLSLGEEMKREGTLEYRLLLAERKRLNAGSNG